MTFIIEKLPLATQQSMKTTGVWQPACPVSLEQLSLVKVLHYDFNGACAQGELMVHIKMAENALAVFKELYDIKFPIEQIKLIDEFNGSDDLSMKNNNTSCFNYRTIAGSDKFSLHAYGLAIDINPIQNPYLTFEGDSTQIHPVRGREYLNRRNLRPGMVEPIVHIFAEHGFDVWGGNWNDPIDYHHFQVERSLLPTA